MLRGYAVWLRYDVVRQSSSELVSVVSPALPTYAAEMGSDRNVEKGVLALTFDDGPSEWTPRILDLLAEHRARATFFLLGDGIAAHEQILERALAEGHELGLHGWSHRHLTELSDAEIKDEMLETRAAIERATGAVASVWRPPYFEVDKRVRRALADSDLVEASCSIAPEDYHWPAARTAAFVIKRLCPGAVVDLHDGRPARSGSAQTRAATIEALGLILCEMERQKLHSVPFLQLPTLEIGAST